MTELGFLNATHDWNWKNLPLCCIYVRPPSSLIVSEYERHILLIIASPWYLSVWDRGGVSFSFQFI